MDQIIARLVAASLSAPSGDNTQPVRFAVDQEARTIALVLDPTRDPSPMNAGQRMARMAAGASLENLIRAAQELGMVVELEPASRGTLAVVRLVGDATWPARWDGAPPDRVTNRRPYDGRSIADDVLGRLALSSPPIDGVTTHWIADRGRIGALADLVGRADAMMFGDPSMRRAFLSKVRFDRPAGERVEEGLSLDSIEASPFERMALRVMRRMPDRLLKLGGASKIFADKARHLVRSASGLCLVVAPDGDDATDLIVGRALQRAWLALAGAALAAQPMMSLMVLENVADRGDRGLREVLGPDKLGAMRAEFRSLAPEIDGRRPAWLMRFGHARPPSGRTGRLPVESVVLGAGRPGDPSATTGRPVLG
jgi:hypothetical protein